MRQARSSLTSLLRESLWGGGGAPGSKGGQWSAFGFVIIICHHNYSHLQKQGGFSDVKNEEQNRLSWCLLVGMCPGPRSFSGPLAKIIGLSMMVSSYFGLWLGTRALVYQQVTLAGCRYCSYSTSVWWKASQLELGREGVDVKVVGPVSFFLAYVEVKKVEYMLVRLHIHESMAVVKVFCSVYMSIWVIQYIWVNSNTVYMSIWWWTWRRSGKKLTDR